MKKPKKIDNKGQSVVEFALVIPIFLLVFVAIIEFGSIWMTMNVLTGASREGARIAAVTEPDEAEVLQAVSDVLASIGIDGESVTIAGPNSAGEIIVTVEINYTTITGSFIPGLASSIELARSTTMHWEG
jgi:Flp pilus assembly protein TadG